MFSNIALRLKYLYRKTNRNSVRSSEGEGKSTTSQPLATAEEVAESLLAEAQDKAKHLQYGSEVVVALDESQRHVNPKELNAHLQRLMIYKYSGLTPSDDYDPSTNYSFTKIIPWNNIR